MGALLVGQPGVCLLGSMDLKYGLGDLFTLSITAIIGASVDCRICLNISMTGLEMSRKQNVSRLTH